MNIYISKEEVKIQHIPAAIWGSPSEKLYLYVHGQGGNKEEPLQIADVACRYGYQILSMDLPEHGCRMHEKGGFVPWHVLPELKTVMNFAQCRWKEISLFASSLGAWFSLLSFERQALNKALFVSPVLDMTQLILKMMDRANVSEAQLKERGTIPTPFGQTLSWKYLQYAAAHPITSCCFPVSILYGKQDSLIDYSLVKQFALDHNFTLTVMPQGEHWFHTKPQLDFLRSWFEDNLKTS